MGTRSGRRWGEGSALLEPQQGDLGSLTFPGPERGARNSSPEVGVRAVSPRVAPPPWASQGHRGADGRTPGRSSAAPRRVRSSPLPQIGAQARNGRAGAHGATAPLDPGRGAPWEAEWEGPSRVPPAPPRGPRGFRSPTGSPGNLDAPPGLYVAGKSLFLSPHYPGRSLLPVPKLGGGEAAIPRVGESSSPLPPWETEVQRRGLP